ncbi:thioesterase [Sphingomonas sp. Root710]|uniref:PaaI family thioesterase n=1 Tax=Sphingomonas sp. Root710 TaxID=1736594 RepID=UPI0006F6BCB1|nr:PaaI family thioesterase [Sphingomonas sp. Root710]KRB86691.1 thioesterase [Sphingomonas sp. Root710]
MSSLETSLYLFEPHPDMPGWTRWRVTDDARFNGVVGDLAVRRDGDRAVIRMQPQARHSNLIDTVHGGALLTLIDNALFIGPRFLGDVGMGGATVDLSTQFTAPANLDQPIDLTLEIMRETRRMLFMRGTLEQGDTMVASFMGIVRKTS